MNVQSDIRQLTDVCGCNLQQHLPCNWLSVTLGIQGRIQLRADAHDTSSSLPVRRTPGSLTARPEACVQGYGWQQVPQHGQTERENSVKWRGKPMKLGSAGELE